MFKAPRNKALFANIPDMRSEHEMLYMKSREKSSTLMGQITAINMFYLNELAPLVFKTERIPNASPTGYCDRGGYPSTETP